MRQRERRVERIADDVAQEAVALQPIQLRHAERMNPDRHVEFLDRCPKWIEAIRTKLLLGDMTAERNTLQAVLPDSGRELLGCELGMLQGDARHRDEPVRVTRADLGEAAILIVDNPTRIVNVEAVPEWIDAQNLDVDTPLVHQRDAAIADDEVGVVVRRRRAEELHRARDDRMRVHVDGCHPLPADPDLAPSLRPRGSPKASARGGEHAGGRAKKFSAIH